jgi:hypothetical protein
MTVIKRSTSLFSSPLPLPPVCVMKEWENHPSLIAGVEALDAYHAWVSRVVLPIAFQWIAEHHDEVYRKISDEKLWDDVGVVIAAAFELVRETEAYKEGVKQYEAYKKDLESGKLDSTNLNPVWTRITREVRKATHGIFQAEKKHLDDTI